MADHKTPHSEIDSRQRPDSPRTSSYRPLPSRNLRSRSSSPHPRNNPRRIPSRSCSPQRHGSHSHRARSPHRRQRHRHKHRHSPIASTVLPHNSRELTKHDFEVFKPMFALYLDVQKGKILEDIDEAEAKGRWKSFLGKWNRGELAEGWYDPATLQKALKSAPEDNGSVLGEEEPQPRSKPIKSPPAHDMQRNSKEEEESDSDDSVGPTLPGHEGQARRTRVGPSIPNMQDLELKNEMQEEDELSYRDEMRYARKLDRKAQKDALNELVPRAEAGTRERQLEKKKEVNEKLKSFREKSPGVAEVPDAELMGGVDGLEGYKKQKQEFERKKNERELRKEEILRARTAEREERLQEYRAKEEGTMKMLRELAQQRFG